MLPKDPLDPINTADDLVGGRHEAEGPVLAAAHGAAASVDSPPRVYGIFRGLADNFCHAQVPARQWRQPVKYIFVPKRKCSLLIFPPSINISASKHTLTSSRQALPRQFCRRSQTRPRVWHNAPEAQLPSHDNRRRLRGMTFCEERDCERGKLFQRNIHVIAEVERSSSEWRQLPNLVLLGPYNSAVILSRPPILSFGYFLDYFN
jgi:hypothetical protein